MKKIYNNNNRWIQSLQLNIKIYTAWRLQFYVSLIKTYLKKNSVC